MCDVFATVGSLMPFLELLYLNSSERSGQIDEQNKFALKAGALDVRKERHQSINAGDYSGFGL